MNQKVQKAALFFSLFASGFIYAQTHLLEGRVLDENDNSPLQGVILKVNGTDYLTDLSGYYSISLEANKTYTLVVSSSGYQSKEIDEVTIKPEENTHLDIILGRVARKENEIEAVIIKSNAKKETIASTIGLQKNAGVVSQVIGVEAIKRSPDKNTGEVLKRVSGVSLVDGKYIVVRG